MGKCFNDSWEELKIDVDFLLIIFIQNKVSM